MEEGYPADALPGLAPVGGLDVPRIGGCAYRQRPGFHEVIYLHAYRPSEHGHRNLDDNLKMTLDEARQLAAGLLALADQIEASM